MGQLDDAIREHLELKRLRGADPSKVAREEQEALGPTRRSEETEPLKDPDDPQQPTTRGAAHPLEGTESIADTDPSHAGQETMELDMRTVLQTESIEYTGPPKPEFGQGAPSSTPSPASTDHPAARLGRGERSAGNSLGEFA
jgi:hypothetical protein